MERKEDMVRTADQEREPQPATELWFTAPAGEEDALWSRMEKEEFDATLRLGDRSTGTRDPKGAYVPGRFVTLKIQRQDGSFDPREKEVVIADIAVGPLEQLEAHAQSGSKGLFEGATPEEMRIYLERVYRREVSSTETATAVHFEYKDALRGAEDLVRTKVLAFAEAPLHNAKELHAERYTLPLIAHDYPAKTPVMWNDAYKRFGLDEANSMMVGDPAFTKEIMEVLRRDPRYVGGGAGVGFKEEVARHLDELDPTAEEAGAVNFIAKTPEGTLRGYNTDGIGYARSLEDALYAREKNLWDSKVILLGAGGTGNGVAFALARLGAKIVILNRTVQKAKALAEKINGYYGRPLASYGGEEDIENEIPGAAAIVNVSTKGAVGPLEKYSALAPALLPATPENIAKNHADAERILASIPQGTILSDIILAGTDTPFLVAAKAKGFPTLDGVPMVIEQGVEAFWILHGKELEKKGISLQDVREVMRTAAAKKE